jgi:hypothetical protein
METRPTLYTFVREARDPNSRNWLTVDDVADLPAMTDAFASVPERVRRAAWFHEYAARTEHVPVRLPPRCRRNRGACSSREEVSTKQFVGTLEESDSRRLLGGLLNTGRLLVTNARDHV